MQTAPRLDPAAREAPSLRLLEGRNAAPESSSGPLRAWILFFGALAFSGGHGVFLFTALTRLAKVPGHSELGGALETAVIAWFVAAVPLALASVPLRGRFLRLRPAVAWSLASAVLVLTLGAFALYLRAVALA